MNHSEKALLGLPNSKIEGGRNIVHQFFTSLFADVNLLVKASRLTEQDKQAVFDFYKEFLSHLEDENYIERVMVSTGPLIPRFDEETQLRRTKLEDGSYSIENSLHVFGDSFDEKFGRKSGEMTEVRKTIFMLLEEALNKQGKE